MDARQKIAVNDTTMNNMALLANLLAQQGKLQPDDSRARASQIAAILSQRGQK